MSNVILLLFFDTMIECKVGSQPRLSCFPIWGGGIIVHVFVIVLVILTVQVVWCLLGGSILSGE